MSARIEATKPEVAAPVSSKKQPWTVEACPPTSSVHTGILQSMRMALRYQHRTPTVAELMTEFGMSRATAFRWIAAFKFAKGGV